MPSAVATGVDAAISTTALISSKEDGIIFSITSTIKGTSTSLPRRIRYVSLLPKTDFMSASAR